MANIVFDFHNFKEVFYEVRDIDFYGVKFDQEKVLMELSYRPKLVSSNVVQSFVHLLFWQKMDDLEGDNPYEHPIILHTDFVSEFKFQENQIVKKNDDSFLKVEPFAMTLGITVSMIRGYLILRNKSYEIGNLHIPIIPPIDFAKNSIYFEDGMINLTKKIEDNH